MRRPTKQDVLGDWSVSTWLYAIGCLVCIGLIELLVVLYVVPAP